MKWTWYNVEWCVIVLEWLLCCDSNAVWGWYLTWCSQWGCCLSSVNWLIIACSLAVPAIRAHGECHTAVFYLAIYLQLWANCTILLGQRKVICKVACWFIYLFVHAFSALTLSVEQQEGHLVCKRTECWYVDGGDLNGALCILARVRLLTPSPPSSLTAVKCRMVWHAGTDLLRLSWKLAVKTSCWWWC